VRTTPGKTSTSVGATRRCAGACIGNCSSEEGGDYLMALLWVLVALLIIFAIVGGAAVNSWLFLIVLVALVLLLIGLL
jgi:hypothetical protein